jgi:hypothetical protein
MLSFAWYLYVPVKVESFYNCIFGLHFGWRCAYTVRRRKSARHTSRNGGSLMSLQNHSEGQLMSGRALIKARLDAIDSHLRAMMEQGDFDEVEYDAIEDAWLDLFGELSELDADSDDD